MVTFLPSQEDIIYQLPKMGPRDKEGFWAKISFVSSYVGSPFLNA
jgi:hypothetical protein